MWKPSKGSFDYLVRSSLGRRDAGSFLAFGGCSLVPRSRLFEVVFLATNPSRCDVGMTTSCTGTDWPPGKHVGMDWLSRNYGGSLYVQNVVLH